MEVYTKISFITATLNADSTLDMAKKYDAKVFHKEQDFRDYILAETDFLTNKLQSSYLFDIYVTKPDLAWFFHPLACEITLWEYGWSKTLSMFKKEEINRSKWSQ